MPLSWRAETVAFVAAAFPLFPLFPLAPELAV
jgi:hypothetical protein